MTATYDPNLVKVTFGPLLLSGFASGSMIAVNHLGDGVTSESGTQGEAVFVENPDRRAEVTIRLFQTAPTNVALGLAYQAGNAPLPLSISSLSTGAIHAAGAAKLKRMPDVDYAEGMPVDVWMLVVPKLESIRTPAPQ